MTKTLNIEALESAMEAKGLNQAGLADALRVSRTTISNWFKGTALPRPDKLLKLGMTLGLPYKQLVVVDDRNAPVVAFRTVKNRPSTQHHLQKAQEMGRLLAELVPYLPFETLQQPPILQAPVNEYSYLQSVSELVRGKIGISATETVNFPHLVRLFKELKTVLIPVLWGSKDRHENAAHIYLPDSMTTWVYLNVDVHAHDFKFWMAHELGHALASQLRGDEAEDFADGFAAALLFPEPLAKLAYAEIKGERPKKQIEIISRIANDQVISLITVYYQINAYAKHKGFKPIDLGNLLFAANTNFNKGWHLISAALFGESDIAPSDFIKRASDVFDTPFYTVLSRYLKENHKSSSFVQTVLDVGPVDAKGMYAELT